MNALRKKGRKMHASSGSQIMKICAVILVPLNVITLCVLVSVLSKKAAREEYPVYFAEYVVPLSEEFGIDPDIVFSVIKTESDFRPEAVSSAGAVGLMQITLSAYEHIVSFSDRQYSQYAFSDMTDPYVNILFGCRYIRYLYDLLGNYELVFAAYNGGITNVLKWLKDDRYSENGKLTHIPFPETENYVKKVSHAITEYKKIYNGEYYNA